ncbi:MAG: Gfo/Idh/MocA family protein [Candidatus Dormibacteraceae bacterium]
MAELRLGIVGLHNHYHAYPMADYLRRGIPGLRLVAVADERVEQGQMFARRYCDGQFHADYQELLERSDIDAVIVTSYTSAHAEQVEAAAAAGKHVLLDKPAATTLMDADRIVAAGRQVKVMMAYLLRFLPIYRRAWEAVDQGVVGELVSASYSIRIPASFIKDSPEASGQGWYVDPVRAGGGGFLDHAIHFTDFFRWFFRSEPLDVVARMGSLTYKDLGVEDYGIATYRLGSGAIVTVESTWHAAEWYGPLASPDRCTLTGTEGEIELHYQRSPQLEIASRRGPYRGRTYVDLEGEERDNICYRNLLTAFADCIREDRPPVPDAEDGRRALEMVLAAYAADHRGRSVSFPLEGEL